MSMVRRILLFLTLAGALVSAQSQVPEPTFPAPAVGASIESLYQLFASYWEWKLAAQPELATTVGRTEYNDRWRDWSKAGRAKAREQRKAFLQELIYISTGNLRPGDRLSAEVLDWELRNAIDAETYGALTERVSQQNGLHSDVFETIGQMPARTVKDYENIIARLRATPVYIDQNIELLRELMAARMTQPPIVVDLTLDQVAAQAKMTAAETPLLAAFRRFPVDILAGTQDRLKAEATAAYEQRFVPAWKKYETFLRRTYRPKARTNIAVTAVPNGRALYDVAVRFHTTTSMPAEAIHELGLREVERIDREMAAIARADGFDGPVADYEMALAARPAIRFASKDEMLEFARGVLARVQPALPKLFSRLPRMQILVRPIPPDREASSASNYEAGTADGSRPAFFNMNTYRPEQQFKYDIPSLVLHETVPGHHLQTAIARESEGLPEFRRVFTTTAFGEGWALYAESLGDELGAYPDAASRFGQLASEKFRAVRLVVDTGMHVKGWSRQRAREYFMLHAPAQSLAEIDRYIAWPGQALAYKMGQLKIRELRDRAQKELGPRFDVREFHDVVLRNGRLPLDLLEEQVREYIDTARASR